MIDFKTYYSSNFRQDINHFIDSIPDSSKFHDDPERRQVVTIQYERLAPYKGHLNFLDKEGKEYFGVALFFTVLADMVCYTYYRQYYYSFQNLTRYPKFIGDCPGGCHFHHDPANIFTAMNKGLEHSSGDRLEFREKFLGSVSTMKLEIIGFFKEYIPSIEGEAFWSKCRNEFPYA